VSKLPPLSRLLIGSVIISFAPVLIRLANADPDLAGFYRMLFAGLGLLPLFLIQGKRERLDRRTFLFIAAAGVSLGTDFMFWHRSINLIGPGLATLLGNFQVFFTAFFSWLLLKERISGLFLVAVALAFGGLLLITGPDVPALAAGVQLGILHGLLTALTYSAYILLLKQGITGSSIGGGTAIFIVSISCTLFLALSNLLKGSLFVLPDGRALLFLAVLGLVCSAFAWSLISSAIKQVPATVAGLVLLLQPALAFVWDVLLFKRVTSGSEYLGILFILAAIYLGTLRRST